MIRTYCFYCETCSYEFDLQIDSEEISGFFEKCPQCKSKNTYRDFARERVSVDDGVPKTVGMLADLNSKKKKINR